jgi:hypothetical protein
MTDGSVQVLAFFPNTPLSDAVPTGLDRGPDGALYIGTLALVDRLPLLNRNERVAEILYVRRVKATFRGPGQATHSTRHRFRWSISSDHQPFKERPKRGGGRESNTR